MAPVSCRIWVSSPHVRQRIQNFETCEPSECSAWIRRTPVRRVVAAAISTRSVGTRSPLQPLALCAPLVPRNVSRSNTSGSGYRVAMSSVSSPAFERNSADAQGPQMRQGKHADLESAGPPAPTQNGRRCLRYESDRDLTDKPSPAGMGRFGEAGTIEPRVADENRTPWAVRAPVAPAGPTDEPASWSD